MDVQNNGTVNGTSIKQCIDNGNDAQRFELIRQDFAVTYNANGGSGAPAAQTKWRDVTLALSSTQPTRTNHSFLGWSTSSTATTATYQPGASYTGNANLTIYAVWRDDTPAVTYTVTYDFAENGGTSATKITEQPADGAAVDLTPTATKSGWTFEGWNTNPDAITALTTLSINKNNVTLYAIYRRTITGTFIDAVGTQTSSVTIYNKATSGTVTSPTQRTYSGWTAQGWSTETNATAGAATVFTVGIDGASFYALYSRNITLSYNTDDGTAVASQTGEQTVNSYDLSNIADPEFEAADAPTKAGYEFVSWETSAGDAVAPGDQITISANTNLKAAWREIPPMLYLVSYSSENIYDAPTPQTKIEGQTLKLSVNIPVRYGYTFKGWAESAMATTAQYQPGGNYTKDASITLYAVWQANTYSIRYNANSGTGTMANSTHTYDIAKTLTANTFSKPGYTFSGWACDLDGEVAFTNRENVSKLTIQNGAVVDLYAVWQPNSPATYTVTLNPNGGSVTPTSITVTNGGTYSALPTPTRSGYTFNGWYTQASGGTKVNPTDTVNLTGNTTLYAHWTQNTQPPSPIQYIFTTKYEATTMNWILFILLFGWLWMWF